MVDKKEIYGVTVDCAKCGMTMQDQEWDNSSEKRTRVVYKCFNCGQEIVVNRWWNVIK